MFYVILDATRQVDWFENFDIDNITTPVKPEILGQLLNEVGYDVNKTKYLVDGFTNGFSLNYCGPRVNIKKTARNLPFTVGDEIDLWNKVMKEVKLGRYAGPFKDPPFKNFVQSPIGLVPKDNGRDTRLIFHLSHPRDGTSINAQIPEDLCSVKYPDFQEAIELCINAGKSAHCSKSDMKSAFRQAPLKVEDFCLMLMKAKNPKDGVTYWFCDKCLPFGSSISCKIVQDISDGVSFIVQRKTGKENINYLDDFLFIALLKACCNSKLQTFLDVCELINLPISIEKTTWGDQIIVFLGLLIDNVHQVVCIPKEKIDRARNLIEIVLGSKKKKSTVINIQRLTGFLNFLCKCVVPGRTFTTRLYSLIPSYLKPHHHIKIPADIIQDLMMWKRFLDSPNVYCRPFLDFTDWTSDDIQMYSDASNSIKRGFGAYCQDDWMAHSWNECGDFLYKEEPGINYLELFAVTAAVMT